jgi:cellobiose-specific phosphotransferase system component IIA
VESYREDLDRLSKGGVVRKDDVASESQRVISDLEHKVQELRTYFTTEGTKLRYHVTLLHSRDTLLTLILSLTPSHSLSLSSRPHTHSLSFLIHLSFFFLSEMSWDPRLTARTLHNKLRTP